MEVSQDHPFLAISVVLSYIVQLLFHIRPKGNQSQGSNTGIKTGCYKQVWKHVYLHRLCVFCLFFLVFVCVFVTSRCGSQSFLHQPTHLQAPAAPLPITCCQSSHQADIHRSITSVFARASINLSVNMPDSSALVSQVVSCVVSHISTEIVQKSENKQSLARCSVLYIFPAWQGRFMCSSRAAALSITV